MDDLFGDAEVTEVLDEIIRTPRRVSTKPRRQTLTPTKTYERILPARYTDLLTEVPAPSTAYVVFEPMFPESPNPTMLIDTGKRFVVCKYDDMYYLHDIQGLTYTDYYDLAGKMSSCYETRDETLIKSEVLRRLHVMQMNTIQSLMPPQVLSKVQHKVSTKVTADEEYDDIFGGVE